MKLDSQNDNTDVDFRRVIYHCGDLFHSGLTIARLMRHGNFTIRIERDDGND